MLDKRRLLIFIMYCTALGRFRAALAFVAFAEANRGVDTAARRHE
jgi:hypothetical protein